MKEKPKKNLQHVVDDALYNELVQLGIVKSWSDLSRQCRKNVSAKLTPCFAG